MLLTAEKGVIAGILGQGALNLFRKEFEGFFGFFRRLLRLLRSHLPQLLPISGLVAILALSGFRVLIWGSLASSGGVFLLLGLFGLIRHELVKESRDVLYRVRVNLGLGGGRLI